MQRDHGDVDASVVYVPSPTVWPMVLALGVSLIAAGMVTHAVVGFLGLVLTLMGGIGWFRQVFPQEQHESIPVKVELVPIASIRTLKTRVPAGEGHRKILPIESFHMATGIKGGIAGGIAMTVPAAIFSLLRYHSIWYAANLLAAGGFVSWAGASDAFLGEFHLYGLLAAVMIHGFTSLLVGLLYGALLPMYPRHPIITAGVTVPLLFTGILHSALGIVSPVLNERIDWFWFVASQVAFGLVCGYVVNRHTKIRTPQFRALPFAVRAGLQSDRGGHSLEQTRSVDEKDTQQ